MSEIEAFPHSFISAAIDDLIVLKIISFIELRCIFKISKAKRIWISFDKLIDHVIGRLN